MEGDVKYAPLGLQAAGTGGRTVRPHAATRLPSMREVSIAAIRLLYHEQLEVQVSSQRESFVGPLQENLFHIHVLVKFR